VSIQLEWFVDNKKQNTVLETQDINDRFRINSTWWELKALVLVEVNYWADKRGLEGSNKPVPIEWLATIGTLSKTSSPIRVKDQVIWAKILTQLRIDDKDSKGRLGRKVHVACVFKCYDRDSTPPPKQDKKARKSHQKHPRRVVGLRQEEEEDEEGENSRSEGDFEDDEEESTLLSSLKRSAISRPSVTQSQLHAKHTRDSKETEQEKVRTELFRLHQCAEERCSNYRSCCYIYKKNHYMMTPQEQME
jgi:hypothetical protein